MREKERTNLPGLDLGQKVLCTVGGKKPDPDQEESPAKMALRYEITRWSGQSLPWQRDLHGLLHDLQNFLASLGISPEHRSGFLPRDPAHQRLKKVCV